MVASPFRPYNSASYAQRQIAQAEQEMAHFKAQALAQEREARLDREKFRRAWTEANDARVFLGLPTLPITDLEF